MAQKSSKSIGKSVLDTLEATAISKFARLQAAEEKLIQARQHYFNAKFNSGSFSKFFLLWSAWKFLISHFLLLKISDVARYTATKYKRLVLSKEEHDAIKKQKQAILLQQMRQQQLLLQKAELEYQQSLLSPSSSSSVSLGFGLPAASSAAALAFTSPATASFSFASPAASASSSSSSSALDDDVGSFHMSEMRAALDIDFSKIVSDDSDDAESEDDEAA